MMLLAVPAVMLALALPAAAQNRAPAKPQTKSLDSEAPPGAPPHWLPNEDWVMQHWLPYDETRLYELLGITRGDLWRLLRDDTRSLADVAVAKGLEPQEVARELVRPWAGKLRDPRRLALLERRALRTLTQGHLAQHIFFHSLHQNAIPDNAPAIFGVASREQFQELRRSELSPVQICRLNGLPRHHAQTEAKATLRRTIERGVNGQAIPRTQAERLLARQLRQVPRWLQQTRYNGPPPLKVPRASAATASNYSNNAVLSADGETVAYESYEARLNLAKTRGEIGVLARGMASAVAQRVSSPRQATQVPRSAYNPAISADGGHVAFEAAPGNLNFAKRYGQMAVFVRDLEAAVTRLASRAAPVGGAPRSAYNPTLSGDGRLVAYESSESGRGSIEVFLTDVATGRTRRISAGAGDVSEPNLSDDGRTIAVTGLSGGRSVVFVQDVSSRRTRTIAVNGDAYEPDLSADGRTVAFTAVAEGRSRVMVSEADGTQATAVAPGEGFAAGASASEPALSADGQIVAFSARGAKDRRTSVYAYDRVTRQVELISRAAAPASGSSGRPAISADGRLVTFTSDAWNLSENKCNAARGVFLRDRATRRTVLLSSDDGANRFLGPTKGSSTGADMTVALICA